MTITKTFKEILVENEQLFEKEFGDLNDSFQSGKISLQLFNIQLQLLTRKWSTHVSCKYCSNTHLAYKHCDRCFDNAKHDSLNNLLNKFYSTDKFTVTDKIKYCNVSLTKLLIILGENPNFVDELIKQNNDNPQEDYFKIVKTKYSLDQLNYALEIYNKTTILD